MVWPQDATFRRTSPPSVPLPQRGSPPGSNAGALHGGKARRSAAVCQKKLWRGCARAVRTGDGGRGKMWQEVQRGGLLKWFRYTTNTMMQRLYAGIYDVTSIAAQPAAGTSTLLPKTLCKRALLARGTHSRAERWRGGPFPGTLEAFGCHRLKALLQRTAGTAGLSSRNTFHKGRRSQQPARSSPLLRMGAPDTFEPSSSIFVLG